MNGISTSWRFEGEAEEAGSVMTAYVELDGSTFVALNGGSLFALNPSCDEIDRLWKKLSEGERVRMPIGTWDASRRSCYHGAVPAKRTRPEGKTGSSANWKLVE